MIISCRFYLRIPSCIRVRSPLRVLLCRFHRADSAAYILSYAFLCTDSIGRIPTGGFHRADSIVRILSCKFYRATVRIPSYREDYTCRFHRAILVSKFHRANSLVRGPSSECHCAKSIPSCWIPSCRFHRMDYILRIPSCVFHRA